MQPCAAYTLYICRMKPVFATTYSTLCPAALGHFIAEQYGLHNVDCQFFLRGVGDTYMVNAAGSRFVWQVYRADQRSLPQIQAEMQLLFALKEAGIGVSAPVADLHGNAIQALEAVEGVKHAVLFTYASGKPATLLSDKQLRHLGTEMAKFHKVSSAVQLQGGRWEITLESTLLGPLERLKSYFEADAEGYAWLKEAAAYVQEKLGQMNTAAFSKGYCHFDFLPKNFHFDDNDAVTFFDFDFVGYGWLANDVMSFWQHLCLDVHFGKMAQVDADKAFATFMEAYRTTRPFTNEEMEAVPYLSLGFWLFYMGFHTTHDQFYPYVQPAHLKLRVDMVRKLMERYWHR